MFNNNEFKPLKVTQIAEEINFQAERREELTDRNLDMLKEYYTNMFKSLCGVIPKFQIVDNKGRIKLYGL